MDGLLTPPKDTRGELSPNIWFVLKLNKVLITHFVLSHKYYAGCLVITWSSRIAIFKHDVTQIASEMLYVICEIIFTITVAIVLRMYGRYSHCVRILIVMKLW